MGRRNINHEKKIKGVNTLTAIFVVFGFSEDFMRAFAFVQKFYVRLSDGIVHIKKEHLAMKKGESAMFVAGSMRKKSIEDCERP